MPKCDSTDTTDPSAPTTPEMDAMWTLARARELEDEAHRRSVNLLRSMAYIDLDLWDANKRPASADYSRSAWEARNVL